MGGWGKGVWVERWTLQKLGLARADFLVLAEVEADFQNGGLPAAIIGKWPGPGKMVVRGKPRRPSSLPSGCRAWRDGEGVGASRTVEDRSALNLSRSDASWPVLEQPLADERLVVLPQEIGCGSAS
jgi:hypothetical protein